MTPRKRRTARTSADSTSRNSSNGRYRRRPLRPGNDGDDDLLRDEAEEEVRLWVRARCGVRGVRPGPRVPGPRRLVPRPSAWLGLETVDFLRQIEVEVRQAAFVVRGQREPDRRPRIRDVRMMVHRLRERADLVDERESLREIAERPGALDRIACASPTRDLAESGRDLVLGKEGSPRHEFGKDHGGQKVGASEVNLI